MSYDLMVFDPSAAPRDRAGFRAWYDLQTQWSESHGYNDPAVTSPELRSWYEAITREFPDMNGPNITNEDFSTVRPSDYSIGKHVIYAAFAWSLAEDAYETVRSLAVQHGLGLYDVSGDEGDGEIHFPGDSLRPPSQGMWREIAADFRKLLDQTGS